MANFDELRAAMHAWVQAAGPLLAAGPTPEATVDMRRWQRDADGVFRNRERVVLPWPHRTVESLQQLPSWRAVDDILHQDERLRVQVDTLIGTAQGASHLDTELACRMVFPSPDEMGDLESAFARRYDKLDKLLAAKEIDIAVVWPIP